MLIAATAALAALRGRTIEAALIAAGAWLPGLGLLAVLVLVLIKRPKAAVDAEVSFLASLTAHLDAGQGLRQALLLASQAAPDLDLSSATRGAMAGAPIRQVADALAPALPSQGTSVATALVLCQRTGGSSAPVFGALTTRAAAELDLRRERRAGAAGAHFSAALLAGGPIVFAATRLTTIAEGPWPTPLLTILGTTMAVAGAAISWHLTRRALR